MFFLILVVFLLVGGLVTLVAVMNVAQLVQMNLLWLTPSLPLGAWLIAAFLFGAVALYLVSVLSAMGDRREIKALRQQVLTLEAQITAMSQTSSAGQTAVDTVSSANTGPLLPMPGVMNTPQPGSRRISTAPLSPLQNFRQ